jgi:phosphoglycolate phosphatase-like HAD superfamily hydrolase
VVTAVLFDVDGTLVDSNDAHAHAWVDAFAEAGVTVDYEKVRCSIGMGGDKLMPAVAGIDEESPQGQRISTRRGEIFRTTYLPALKPFRDAGALVAALERRGIRAVAATSAKREELEPLLRIANATSLLGGASGDEADQSKPDPDIIQAALKKAKASPDEAIMIGDTPYDVEAAARAGVKTIAFRCGGWKDEALKGAEAIYDGPSHLLAELPTSPLG